jgi:hypothetical protein
MLDGSIDKAQLTTLPGRVGDGHVSETNTGRLTPLIKHDLYLTFNERAHETRGFLVSRVLN